MARPEPGSTGDGQPDPTGIDYLRVLDKARGEHLQQQIKYAALYEHHQQPGGQP